MVGHTANVEAIVRAVETVDRELARLMDALEKAGGRAFVTADHGNAEQNIDPQTGEKHTAHTLHVVPAILTSESGTLESGTLADIAPTVLAQLGLAKPSAMTGRNLYREF
jgi:2,3-bisphosphoglycerate-independent phosphoglycerate mutase